MSPESPDQKEYWKLYEDSLPPLKWWQYPCVITMFFMSLVVVMVGSLAVLFNRKKEKQ